MKYIFHPGENLIPKAIYLAQMRKPCAEIKEKWESAITKDVNDPNPRFCWHQFLTGMIP